ncbi:response regulator transcription factor [Paenimyroides baculatum]|uniref:Response regulator transcription factor n=1 Tax=Paenimyroides baculatum TaxID=2608000 RepID=A0A5M6CFP1_9FLAO|nr:response regulator transcription factor [Paenimyroides baculatum]KAA5533951.1 response regulator transcription factor [Paenimyroides baculatum]
MLRVAITDDHTLFRKSLGMLVNNFADMQVVLEAGNGSELLEKLQNTSADILLLDLQMPEMDGFETAKRIKERYPEIKILILTLMSETDIIDRVIKMGVNGYFTKNTPPQELEDAIWNLSNDGFYFEESLSTVINKILNDTETEIIPEETINFTERELEVIKFTAEGFKAREIAEALYISPKTVNNHKQNIQNKYQFESMMTAILYCLNNRLIDVDLNSSKK